MRALYFSLQWHVLARIIFAISFLTQHPILNPLRLCHEEFYIVGLSSISTRNSTIRSRGFARHCYGVGSLVERRANEILLCTGSHEDDLKLLKEILPETRFHVREITNDHDHLATISVPQEITREDILNIVSSGQPTGAGIQLKGMGWESFQNCAFGAKVEVRRLDIGVALMVKTLSLAGVLTNYSCDGFAHGDDHYPWIGLHGPYHYGWCKKVIHMATPLAWINDLENFAHVDGGGWMREFSWRIAAPGYDQQTEEAFQTFRRIQCVARNLMRPEVYNPLRTLKEQMSREDLQ